MPTHRSSIGAGRMNRPTCLAALRACAHVLGHRTGRVGGQACDTRSAVTMETETKTTNIDPVGPNGWSIRDEVTQFREWGSHVSYPFPPKHVASMIGASRDCWLRLWDPNGSVSRSHAMLTHGKDGWFLEDLGSKNGMYLDGARVPALSVVPGAEIRIGEVTLIAESPKLVALRALLERFLGWDDERRELVDHALFSVRVAATHREPLLLCGEGNLLPVARLLHQHALGDRPFVVARPRSRHARGMDALAEAAGGTLCVWEARAAGRLRRGCVGAAGPFRESPARGVRTCSAEGERRRLADRHERPVDRPPALVEPRPGAAPHHRRVRPGRHLRVRRRVARIGRLGMDRAERGQLLAADRHGDASDRRAPSLRREHHAGGEAPLDGPRLALGLAGAPVVAGQGRDDGRGAGGGRRFIGGASAGAAGRPSYCGPMSIATIKNILHRGLDLEPSHRRPRAEPWCCGVVAARRGDKRSRSGV